MSSAPGTVGAVSASLDVVLPVSQVPPPTPPLAVYATLAPGAAPPALLVVSVSDPAVASSPRALWRENHELAFGWHPALLAHLRGLGGRVSRCGSKVSFPRARTDLGAVLSAFDGVYLDAEGDGRSRAARLEALCGSVGVSALAPGSGRRVVPARVVVSLSARLVRLELVVEPTVYANVEVSAAPVSLDHRGAAAVLAEAARRRVLCADGSTPPRFAAAAALAAASC